MIKQMLSKKMLRAFVMGFSCGLPLLLTLSLLQAWMQQENVDIKMVGMVSLIGLPYTLKFLWAPFSDRYVIKFFGRRRGWLLLFQIFLAASIMLIGFTNPGTSPLLTACAAFITAFFSASQDIVTDAYRREDLSDKELGLGSSLYVNGYRLGMLLASGGGLIMSDHFTFQKVYFIMGLCMIPGIITTLLSPEPKAAQGMPKTLKESVIEPLKDYFSRDLALPILAFILLYKIGDTMASGITTYFYLDIGFTKSQIGTIVKMFGTWATIAGGLIGGVIMLKVSIRRALWIFGFLQALSTAGFALLAAVGNLPFLLAAVIAFENLTGGMGTAAYAAFMASITNRKFTATQYALLTSLMGIPRVVLSAPTGIFAEFFGWETFFILCAVAAIPGMIILFKVMPDSQETKGNL